MIRHLKKERHSLTVFRPPPLPSHGRNKTQENATYSRAWVTQYYSILTITRHSQPSNSSNHLIPLRTQQPIVIIISFCGAWSGIMFYYIVCLHYMNISRLLWHAVFNNPLFYAPERKLHKNYIQLNISVSWVTNFGQLWIVYYSWDMTFHLQDISFIKTLNNVVVSSLFCLLPKLGRLCYVMYTLN